MNCPNCHAPVRPEAKFCAKCGTSLTEVYPPEKPKKVNRWLFAVAGLVFAIILVISSGVLGRNTPKQSTEAPAEEASQTVEASATTDVNQTPTLDVADELWEQAQAALENDDIPGAADLLLRLRDMDSSYKSTELRSQLENVCTQWYDESRATISPDILAAGECLTQLGLNLPEDIKWWQNYFSAAEYVSSRSTEEAIALLEPLVSEAPNNFASGEHIALLYGAYLQMGDDLCAVAESSEDYATARSWYSKARRLTPGRLEAGQKLARCAPPTPTPTITPTPTLTQTPLPPGTVIIARYEEEGRFNVYMGPGFNFPIVEVVEAGANFTVTGRSPDAKWLQALDIDEHEVWVFSDLLQINYPPEAASVVSSTPVPPTDYVVADSVADFRPQQGANRWFYLVSQSPGSLDYEFLPREGNWFRWTKGGRSPETRLSQAGSYPSWNSDVMRMWVNFYQGRLRIEGVAHKERKAGYGGNGVELRIVQRRTAEDGSTVFSKQLWEATLGPYDIKGISFQIEPFDVELRDEIYFITSAQGNDTQDNTVFTVRVILVNEGGIELPPTPTPLPTPTKPPPPPLCFKPRLRHYERSHGGVGETVGYIYDTRGNHFPVRATIRVQSPPGPDQWSHDFPITGDGGYEVTALTTYGLPFYYSISLAGYSIRNLDTFKLDFPEGARRAVVDWYQVSCK